MIIQYVNKRKRTLTDQHASSCEQYVEVLVQTHLTSAQKSLFGLENVTTFASKNYLLYRLNYAFGKLNTIYVRINERHKKIDKIKYHSSCQVEHALRFIYYPN